jgi:hypothetical protein
MTRRPHLPHTFLRYHLLLWILNTCREDMHRNSSEVVDTRIRQQNSLHQDYGAQSSPHHATLVLQGMLLSNVKQPVLPVTIPLIPSHLVIIIEDLFSRFLNLSLLLELMHSSRHNSPFVEAVPAQRPMQTQDLFPAHWHPLASSRSQSCLQIWTYSPSSPSIALSIQTLWFLITFSPYCLEFSHCGPCHHL